MAAVRRWWQACWPAVAVIVLIAIVVVLCLMGSSSSGATRRASLPRFGRGRVLVGARLDGDALVTGRMLYLATQHPGSVRDALVRIDPATGRVLARRRLGAIFDAGTWFDGSLWIVTTGVTPRSGSALWRLDPETLAVRQHRLLPGSRDALFIVQPFAVADGRLWLAYDGRLAQVDPRTGALAPARRIARAREVEILAAPGGRTLILSAGDGSGRGWLQERSAADGAFEHTSRNYEGVAIPRLGGVYRGRLWITQSTGMMGYAQAVSLRTLRPLRTPGVPRVVDNAIEARIIDGMLFIIQGAGGPTRNYCGDPITGAPRATLPAPEQWGGFGGVLRNSILYAGPPTHGAASGPLDTAPIPAACR